MKKLSFFALLVWFVTSQSCNNPTGNTQVSDSVSNDKAASSDLFKTIYLWGSKTAWPFHVPGFLDSVSLDHAYATDYSPIISCPVDSNYWYCLGATHPSASDSIIPACYHDNAAGTMVGQGIGNVSFASRLVTPNHANKGSSNCPQNYGGPTGGMPWPYGAYGVCHQVANRAAYATYWQGPNTYGQPVSLPKNFPGYRYTHFLYGTYGYQATSNFVPRIDSLGGNSSYVGDNGDSLEKQWLIEDVGKDVADVMWPAYEDARKFIQAEVSDYVIKDTPDCNQTIEDAAKRAVKINKKVSDLMKNKLLPILGKNDKEKKERFAKMFGFTPDKIYNLIDGSHVRK